MHKTALEIEYTLGNGNTLLGNHRFFTKNIRSLINNYLSKDRYIPCRKERNENFQIVASSDVCIMFECSHSFHPKPMKTSEIFADIDLDNPFYIGKLYGIKVYKDTFATIDYADIIDNFPSQKIRIKFTKGT